MKGNFFKCIQYMYQNSTAKLKLLDKISEAIDILIGTEQGHPMSPELFKTYLLDRSIDLNDTTGVVAFGWFENQGPRISSNQRIWSS